MYWKFARYLDTIDSVLKSLHFSPSICDFYQYSVSIFEIWDFRHKSQLSSPLPTCLALQCLVANLASEVNILIFQHSSTTNTSSNILHLQARLKFVAFDTGASSPNSSRAVLHYNSIGRATTSALMAGARVSISTPPPPYVAANICK